jgi:hypothetical protein
MFFKLFKLCFLNYGLQKNCRWGWKRRMIGNAYEVALKAPEMVLFLSRKQKKMGSGSTPFSSTHTKKKGLEIEMKLSQNL